ncbi:uncharacterized protein [Triticum aestivum]|uniref:uncharacterized protein n=1 Tax=Triticum aestivum TaxID=4565 RepID=UPI001D01C310|nr:uncharacterized protein LOC123179633 [Triticum aestivum]
MGKRPPVVIPLVSLHSPFSNLKNSTREEETPSSKAFSTNRSACYCTPKRERIADAACGEMVCRTCLSPCNRESKGSIISMYLWKEFKNAWNRLCHAAKRAGRRVR